MKYLKSFFCCFLLFQQITHAAYAYEIKPLWTTNQLISECQEYYEFLVLRESKLSKLSKSEIDQAQYCYNVVDTALDALKAINGIHIARGNKPIFCAPEEIKTSDVISQMVTQERNGFPLMVGVGHMISYLLVNNYPCH